MLTKRNQTSFKKNDPRFKSTAFRTAISLGLKGKCIGEKSSQWKGGISKRYLTGRVMHRDNFACRQCGLHDPEVIEVDHIQPTYFRPDLEKDMNNMITLCANCHKRKTRNDSAMINLWRKLNKNYVNTSRRNRLQR